MPLLPVSPNAQASHVAAGKRPHNDFIEVSVDAPDCENLSTQKSTTTTSTATIECQTIEHQTIECQPQPLSPPVIKMASPGSSPAALTETSSSTPTRGSPSPNVTPSKSTSPKTASETPARQQPTAKPSSASKRKRNLTAEEKEKERAEKKQKRDEAATEKARIAAEKEAIKAAKAAEKATKAAEKATKAAEKARIDQEKEALKAAKAAKAAEKAKADAAKEAKKQKKQEEELAAKSKKEKQQNMMASFLKKAPTVPHKTNDPITAVKADTGSPSSKQEAKPTKSTYELNFKPFFVKRGVTMAAPLFEMDDTTKEAKSAILDEYIRGDRGEFAPKRPFDAAEVFQLAFPQQRGIIPPSVKKIMEKIHGDNYQNSFGITNARSESQTEKLFINAQDQLDNIPMKYIRFYEDVRPAYFGTVTTSMTHHQLRKLSRRPAGRILPLAYDYDSEAEWVEDDGEDLDDAEDDEEDVDGDEEMDDFVDDSEAIPTIIRPGFEADSMPVSTGLCYENQKRLGPCATVYKYRLEFLLEHHSMINPFSTEYWPTPVKKAAPSATASSTKGTITSMLTPAATRDTATSAPGVTPDLKDGVPHDILEDFKRALLSDECKDYSKATVIEMLAKKFTSCTKAQVKVTLDTIAHRVTPAGATKKSVKTWTLLPNFGLQET
ncbi:chromatin assembly factor 1 subunit A-domain-containing protein [Nemania abortiva]|nr:chromatin assembly factor 1 subunit A-domain-containing protein [Nemania abortiva]